MSKIKTDSTQYKDMFLNNEKHLGQNKKMFVSMLAAEWLFFLLWCGQVMSAMFLYITAHI